MPACVPITLQGDAYDAFISVAQKSEDATFLETTKKDVAKAAGLSSAGVAVITNFEGECWCVTGRDGLCCFLPHGDRLARRAHHSANMFPEVFSVLHSAVTK